MHRDEFHCSELLLHPDESACEASADPALLLEIDQAFLTDCGHAPRDLARLAAMGMKAFGSELPELTCHWFALRALSLVDAGRLRVAGERGHLSVTILQRS